MSKLNPNRSEVKAALKALVPTIEQELAKEHPTMKFKVRSTGNAIAIRPERK